MSKTAVDQKIELVRQLGIVLQGEVKPSKTQQTAVDLAKTFERRKCNHREPIPGDECLASVVGPTNKHRYVIATQSQPLRVKLRSIPAVPIVHINRTVMVLEPPSDLTLETKAAMEEQTLHPSASDLTLVGSSTSVEPPPRKKKKGPKGPNPLSVKKKKPADGTTSAMKGKAKGANEYATKMPKPSAGEKRKRDEDRESNEVDLDPGVDEFTPVKKRRRRKNVVSETVASVDVSSHS
ncbi:hypothetical protein DXG01_000075 [Tephrocybe rancida]|nr:hypothetical protein DXG01_000075 [Tephrocybe rancida]